MRRVGRVLLWLALFILLAGVVLFLFQKYGLGALLAPVAGVSALLGVLAKGVGARKVERPGDGRPRRGGVGAYEEVVTADKAVSANGSEGGPGAPEKRPKRARRGGF